MLGHNLGAERTFARINNYEYLLPKNKELFQKIGVDSMIYPEMLAAKEIVDDLLLFTEQWQHSRRSNAGQAGESQQVSVQL